MRSPEDIILRPYITEKSNGAVAEGKYTFIVHPKATKTEIKHAIEKLFDVKVLSVNTMNCPGKAKRVRYHRGMTSEWKKAIVKINLDPKAQIYKAKEGKDVVLNKKYKNNIEEFGAVQ